MNNGFAQGFVQRFARLGASHSPVDKNVVTFCATDPRHLSIIFGRKVLLRRLPNSFGRSTRTSRWNIPRIAWRPAESEQCVVYVECVVYVVYVVSVGFVECVGSFMDPLEWFACV